MTSRVKQQIKKSVLLALVATVAFGVMVAQAAPRQCRFQHCWDFFGVPICYYDSGWIDC